MSLKETQKQGHRTLVAIAIIGVAVYLGFSPLFELVPSGVPQAVISSSFGAIFVIILTMYLLNKQTEVEQESKRGERIFDEKVKLYSEILETTKSMLEDGFISKNEINKLPFPVIKLQMLGNEDANKSYLTIYKELNEIYSRTTDDDVEVKDEDKSKLYPLLISFASTCRKDIGISDKDLDKEILNITSEVIIDTGKKQRDTTKFSFNGKTLAKNWYALEVISNYVRENSPLSLEDFSSAFPRDLKGTSHHYELWKTYDEAIAHYEESDYKYTRYFVSKNQGKASKARNPIEEKDLVIKLSDEEVCISNQWDIDSITNFVNHINDRNISSE